MAHVRDGNGPALLRLEVPRLCGHSGQDTQAYKSPELHRRRAGARSAPEASQVSRSRSDVGEEWSELEATSRRGMSRQRSKARSIVPSLIRRGSPAIVSPSRRTAGLQIRSAVSRRAATSFPKSTRQARARSAAHEHAHGDSPHARASSCGSIRRFWFSARTSVQRVVFTRRRWDCRKRSATSACSTRVFRKKESSDAQ